MEIKFWDKLKLKYVDDEFYYIDDELIVYVVIETPCNGITHERNNIEPHFYLNKERIA